MARFLLRMYGRRFKASSIRLTVLPSQLVVRVCSKVCLAPVRRCSRLISLPCYSRWLSCWKTVDAASWLSCLDCRALCLGCKGFRSSICLTIRQPKITRLSLICTIRCTLRLVRLLATSYCTGLALRSLSLRCTIVGIWHHGLLRLSQLRLLTSLQLT